MHQLALLTVELYLLTATGYSRTRFHHKARRFNSSCQNTNFLYFGRKRSTNTSL